MPDTPGLPNIPVDEIKEKAQQAMNDAPPEIKQAVVKSTSFYQENKSAVNTIVFLIVVMKINKSMVRRATAKAVDKALASMPADVALTTNPEIESLEQIVKFLRATPGMTYIAKGGKMLHVLLENDKVLTFIDDFDRMTDAQVNAKLFHYFTKTQASLKPIK